MKAYNKLKKLAKDRIDEYIEQNNNDIYSISTFIIVTLSIILIYFILMLY